VYDSNTATLIKIHQLDMFMERSGMAPSVVAQVFRDCDVYGYIDDTYEFLHIQGDLATYEDISKYIDSQKRAA
jgi:hypothetical protein